MYLTILLSNYDRLLIAHLATSLVKPSTLANYTLPRDGNYVRADYLLINPIFISTLFIFQKLWI